MIARNSDAEDSLVLSTRFNLTLVDLKGNFLEKLVQMDKDLDEAINKIFNDFDRDNSGFIDLNEL
jgi:Ca2+-binding EF-hand superfamily protein